MTYKDIHNLPSYTFEMLSEIMIIEEQYQQREIESRSKRK
jgi:hypothetical protein